MNVMATGATDRADEQLFARDMIDVLGAEAAVAAVQESLAQDRPFAVVFLDMRMPPGRDGVWAATRIRELDPIGHYTTTWYLVEVRGP